MQNRTEIWENKTVGETQFIGGTSVAQIKNSKLTKLRQLYRSCCVKNSDQKVDLVIFKDFCNEANRICFLDSMSELLIHLPPEAKTWHKS